MPVLPLSSKIQGTHAATPHWQSEAEVVTEKVAPVSPLAATDTFKGDTLSVHGTPD